jgi:hypothetical protein
MRVAQHAVLGGVLEEGQVPEGRLNFAQDASPGFAGLWRIGKNAQDYVLGNFQSSLAGLVRPSNPTQHCVLGYYQPSLRD